MNEHHEITQLLLRNGDSIDRLINEGYNPLLQSCGYVYFKVVEELTTHHIKVKT